MTDAVPHDWLFLKVSAVVHHGGAGPLLPDCARENQQSFVLS
jgi:hypothetical protein